MDLLLVAAGLAALFFGGGKLVDGAVAIAARMGISPLVIGLTVVGFGTSAPELVTSLQAALKGSPGIALGNVIGSNIANILLILGLAALVAPVAVAPGLLRRDGVALVGATLLAAALLLPGTLTRPGGLLLIVGLLSYLVFALRTSGETQAPASLPEPDQPGNRLLPALLTFGIGLGVTLLGAQMLVSGAISLARGLAVPEAVIGLTIVAVGTSLPELATSLVAARRGQSDVAIGNVVGSNIFNLLGILGVTALVQPVGPFDGSMTGDLLVMIGATALLLLVAATDRVVNRREGALLLALYLGYIGWLALGLS